MAQEIYGPLSLPASGALPQFCRVKLDSSGELAKAGADDENCIGTTLEEAFEAGEYVPVRPLSSPGKHIMIASKAIAIDDTVYAAADGEVTDSGNVRVGVPASAASGDGSQIEVIPLTEIYDST